MNKKLFRYIIAIGALFCYNTEELDDFGQRPISLWLKLNMYFVYFAKSLRNLKIYVGSTGKQPSVRVEEHNNGSNTWSRQNKPLKLVYYESYICESDAKRREMFYKTGIGKKIKYAIVHTMDD